MMRGKLLLAAIALAIIVSPAVANIFVEDFDGAVGAYGFDHDWLITDTGGTGAASKVLVAAGDNPWGVDTNVLEFSVTNNTVDRYKQSIIRCTLTGDEFAQLTPNTTYDVSVWYRCTTPLIKLGIKSASASLNGIDWDSGGQPRNEAWTQLTGTVSTDGTLGTAGTCFIGFRIEAKYPTETITHQFANFVITPEPLTLSLLAVGIPVVMAARKRR